MLQNKILKSVTDTWSNAHVIPKGNTLDKLLPVGEGEQMEAVDMSRKMRFI